MFSICISSQNVASRIGTATSIDYLSSVNSMAFFHFRTVNGNLTRANPNIRLTSHHPSLSVCRVKSNIWEPNIRRFDQLVMNIRLKNRVRQTRIRIFGYSSSRILALGGQIFEIPSTASESALPADTMTGVEHPKHYVIFLLRLWIG